MYMLYRKSIVTKTFKRLLQFAPTDLSQTSAHTLICWTVGKGYWQGDVAGVIGKVSVSIAYSTTKTCHN